MKNLINLLLNWLNINPQKKDEDMPLAFAEIGKALLGLMLDKANTALAEHITEQINKNCSDDTKKLLDGGIEQDISHGFKSLTEMLDKNK
tara:strand:+ start:958 stop:1227 length:270 start_codon:yes stop_codon:yes gene_type:complete